MTNTKMMGQFVQSEQDAWANYDKLSNDPRVVFLTEISRPHEGGRPSESAPSTGKKRAIGSAS